MWADEQKEAKGAKREGGDFAIHGSGLGAESDLRDLPYCEWWRGCVNSAATAWHDVFRHRNFASDRRILLMQTGQYHVNA